MLGENIRKRRKELKLSQQHLADLLGYKSKSSIAKIEKGASDITQSKLTAFANVLNTTEEYLLTGKGSGNSNIVISMQNNTPQIERLYFQPEEKTDRKEARVIAVILAGGNAATNYQNIPNQFANINGKPIIIYSMEAYQKHPAIDDIYVVCIHGWEKIITSYAKNYDISKLRGIIPAGQTGAKSVKSAVEWLSVGVKYEDVVIMHESTRPMVTGEMISNIIQCAREHGSAVTFEPMDEYLQFRECGGGVEYVDRSKMISIQSPEAYLFGKLHRTIMEGIKIQHAFNETCCAMIMYNLNKKLVFCKGNRYNIKIVRQEDLHLFEALLKAKPGY